ncbi:acyltransferase family protein [Mangrovihabitans endophyticus]|uniref:Acyltransferase n=1 Tax=Mangrovihabitans endophyticus TaxID=1751298 RepID=A0A8J3FRQ0_9ACTN|nr:acyltransferase family protein [Mangrovihabitans endophyticus]GGL08798.1 acyltransferase [Mangrovihabitans endophyticus]
MTANATATVAPQRVPGGRGRPGVHRRTRAGRPRGSGFRPDIEGLRAVAVLLVVLNHAGVPWLGGGYVGVDVFFVISGYLITDLLVRERLRTGTISVTAFYARRALRLLPAATVVLLATLAGAWLWLSPLQFVGYAHDAAASATYWINIRLALDGTDYLAATAPSPFQHFWSLTVEEQFYLVWPAIILITTVRRGHRAALVVLASLIACSYVLSVTETDRSAPWAYFGAHTRVWELGIGALIALASVRVARLPRRIARPLVWTGLAAVLASAVVFDEGTAFPGYVAALPVLGAALVIAGGLAGPDNGLLGLAVMQHLGRYSYSWYLWHWPMLLIAPAALGVTADPVTAVLLATAALALAVGTYHLVEDPLRRRVGLRRPPLRGVAFGLGLAAVTVTAALLAATAPPPVPVGAAAADLRAGLRGPDPGAALAAAVAAADPDGSVPANLEPSLDHAASDRPRLYRDGCHLDFAATATPARCVYGDPTGRVTVALLGDSHAAQWFPALELLARQRHWRLRPFTKSACTAADATVYQTTYKRAYTECDTWRRNTIDTMRTLRPDLVVVASSLKTSRPHGASSGADATAEWRAAWARTFGALRATGARVAWVADTPFLEQDAPECLAAHPDRVGSCAVRRDAALRGLPVRRAVAADAPGRGITVIEPLPWLCATSCPVIVDDVLVYRDSHHLTTVYATLLAPLLGRALPAI